MPGDDRGRRVDQHDRSAAGSRTQGRHVARLEPAEQGGLEPGGLGVPADRQPAVGQQHRGELGVREHRRSAIRLRTANSSWASGSSVAGAGSTRSPSMRDLERLRVDLDRRQGVVVHHVGLADVAGRADAGQLRGAGPAARPGRPRGRPAPRTTPSGRRRRRLADQRRAHQHRLRRGDRRVRVAERGPHDRASLDHHVGAPRRRTSGPTARGRRACPARPTRPRGRCRGRWRG